MAVCAGPAWATAPGACRTTKNGSQAISTREAGLCEAVGSVQLQIKLHVAACGGARLDSITFCGRQEDQGRKAGKKKCYIDYIQMLI